MPKQRVILVTGVSSSWGKWVAKSLLAGVDLNSTEAVHVLGVDAEPPETEIQGLDFIQADIRNPLLLELLQMEQVDTVCHLYFMEELRPSEASFDVNVMGTMKLLGACAEAGVRKVILKSSTAVYGALPNNSAFLTEEQPLQASRPYGYHRDLMEVEAFCNGFRHQVPEMILTLLRFANIVGPHADTPMTRFLREPWTPSLLGFDPMMQVIHEQDVVGALLHAVQEDVSGVFNIAAEGVLPLTKLMALAGKLPLPVFHPLAYWGAQVLGGSVRRAAKLMPIELDFLRYPWVGDLSRMREEFGFTPRYGAEETLREFAGQQRLRRYLPEKTTLAYDEERLRDTMERRRRDKERQVAQLESSVEEE